MPLASSHSMICGRKMHTLLTKPVYTCSTVNTRYIIHVLASVVLANYNTGTCSHLKEEYAHAHIWHLLRVNKSCMQGTYCLRRSYCSGSKRYNHAFLNTHSICAMFWIKMSLLFLPTLAFLLVFFTRCFSFCALPVCCDAAVAELHRECAKHC